MSLLRDVLRKNRRGGVEESNDLSPSPHANLRKKGYAASIRSSGGESIRSVAMSIASFYSTITGTRIPKRRRADFSTLGVPTWYRMEPPLAPDMSGTERVDEDGPFTALHGSSLQADGVPPWLSVILYNYGSDTSRLPRYYNEAKVQGELRMVLNKPKRIASLDVWCIGKSESVLELGGVPFLTMHANLWKRAKGDPRNHNPDVSRAFKGTLPAGTYTFPFEFPAFPRDIPLELPPDSTARDRTTRVALPPSCQFGTVGGFQGTIQYYVGVNLKYDDLTSVDEEYDMPFQYFQRARPVFREISPFPFISTREDWPFRREVLGGWTLTPFGGRGRFHDEVVEVEGILGVQTPETYVAGQTVRFGLLLWSTSPAALQALSHPEAIDVVLIRSDLYGTDVLRPRNASRRNRTLHRISQGRIWRTDDGPPSDDEMPQLRPVFPPSLLSRGEEKRVTLLKQIKPRVRVASRFEHSFTADDIWPVEEKELNPLAEFRSTPMNENASPGEGNVEDIRSPRSPSPTSSSSSGFHDEEEGFGDTIRMDGDVRVVRALPTSFRFKYMGCEYFLQLTIMHPEYSHISPSGPGIQAETPVWVVTDPPRDRDESGKSGVTPNGSNPSDLPIIGNVADIGSDLIRAPRTLGQVTSKERPTWRTQKMSAF